MTTFKDGELKPKMVARLISLTEYCDSKCMGSLVGTLITISRTRFCDTCKILHYYVNSSSGGGDLNLENFVKANSVNE
jgi:hypothetical protein